MLASCSRSDLHRIDLLTAVGESRDEAEGLPNNGQARYIPSTGASEHGAATSTTDLFALTANRAVLLLGNRRFHEAYFRASPYAMPENDVDTEADHGHCPRSTMGHTVIKHEARPKRQARRRDGIPACAPPVVTAVTADSTVPFAPRALTSVTTASINP